MTPESQRIAIATACGLDRNSQDIPDYLNDLNATHEMEKVLQANCKFWPDYIDELSKQFRLGFASEINWGQMCHATAAQRCEAFLRAKNLWKD